MNETELTKREQNRAQLTEALNEARAEVNRIIGDPPSMPILNLLNSKEDLFDVRIEGALTVRQWRLIRFALRHTREVF